MGIIAMKIYLRGLAARISKFTSIDPFFRFALSQAVTTAVIGCDDLGQLEENVGLARSLRPLSNEEMRKLEDIVSPYARKLMYYKP